MKPFKETGYVQTLKLNFLGLKAKYASRRFNILLRTKNKTVDTLHLNIQYGLNHEKDFIYNLF